jgi:hypothetical protein
MIDKEGYARTADPLNSDKDGKVTPVTLEQTHKDDKHTYK